MSEQAFTDVLEALDSGELEHLEGFNRHLARHYDQLTSTLEDEAEIEMAELLLAWRQSRARTFAAMAARRELQEIELVERGGFEA